MKQSRFESIGACLPETVVSSEKLMTMMRNQQNFDLEARTGIKSRRVRSANEDSLTIAVDAARSCLSRSRYKAEELDVIISTSISRFENNIKYHDEPSFSYHIKQAIGARNAMHFDISNACAGMITGGGVLNNMIRSGKVKNGMVVSGEYITIIAETALNEISGNADLQFPSLTVGDSGAAYILDRSETGEGIELADMVTIAKHADLCFGMPSSERPGFAMYTRAKEIHEESLSRWPGCVEKMFERRGIKFNPADYDHLITHQTSTSAIKNFIKQGVNHFGADMPPELYSVVDHGNTATTTHFIVLYNKLKEGVITPGSKILFVSNASGLIIGCLSVKLGDVRF